MMRWQTPVIGVCLIFLAAVPAYCQRGTIGVDVGQVSDRFGGLARSTSAEGIVDGEVIVLKSKDEKYGADVVAGGELRLPVDTSSHAWEESLYGGTKFRFGQGLSIGFHVQVHRIYLPASTIDNAVFSRDRLSLLELPGFMEYKFGPERHAFVQAMVGPEFTPHFHARAVTTIPHPILDHGYFIRGTVGYNLGKFYVKGNYETRYFKFRAGTGNPDGLYNWRSDMVTGGVGFVF